MLFIYLFIYFYFLNFCIASQVERRHMGSYNSRKIQLMNQHELTFL